MTTTIAIETTTITNHNDNNQIDKLVEFAFFSELFVQVCYVRLSNGRVVKASWEKF